MSASYRAVQWNGHKKRYDLLLAGGVVVYLASFVSVGSLMHSGDRAVSPPILLMRACGTCAFFLLHVILCIGPLARLDRRFLPLLYNRRHLGVVAFLVALLHGAVALVFYHGFGVVSPAVSLFTSNAEYGSFAAFPFEVLGLAGLLVLFLMAATSHDFWLKNLSPSIWKGLHMLIYPAWAALVMHVALGAMQSERSLAYPILIALGIVIVAALHVAAGRRGHSSTQHPAPGTQHSQFVDVCAVSDIPDTRAKVIHLTGREKIAVFRNGDALSALSNVCIHQGGPLGEGKIVDGCVTCPWHGYQYRPEDGCSPPPFTEKVPTYRIRVEAGRVWLDPTPLPPGTPVEPARIEAQSESHTPAPEVTHV